jgi:hypothetical protein
MRLRGEQTSFLRSGREEALDPQTIEWLRTPVVRVFAAASTGFPSKNLLETVRVNRTR